MPDGEESQNPEVEESRRENSTDVENCLQKYPPLDDELVNIGELG